MRYSKSFLNNVAIELNEIYCAIPPIHSFGSNSLFTDIVNVSNEVPPDTYAFFSRSVARFLKKEGTFKKRKNKISDAYAPIVRSVAPIPFF